jgi:hypothetical protein
MDKHGDIEFYRKEQKKRLEKLHDFTKEYTVERFLADLNAYFDNEVDFDLDKVRAEVSRLGELKGLVDKALAKNTHPISEFLKQLFKKSTKE